MINTVVHCGIKCHLLTAHPVLLGDIMSALHIFSAMPARKDPSKRKKNHTIRFTDPDWSAINRLANLWGYRSVGDLNAAIANGKILLVPGTQKGTSENN